MVEVIDAVTGAVRAWPTTTAVVAGLVVALVVAWGPRWRDRG